MTAVTATALTLVILSALGRIEDRLVQAATKGRSDSSRKEKRLKARPWRRTPPGSAEEGQAGRRIRGAVVALCSWSQRTKRFTVTVTTASAVAPWPCRATAERCARFHVRRRRAAALSFLDVTAS